MDPAANPPRDDPDDAAALARHAEALADLIDATVAGWAERCVIGRWAQWRQAEPTSEVSEAAREAGERVRAEVMPALRGLLGTDVDEQRSNPLSILRGAVAAPTAALRALDVPPVVRDKESQRLFPDDDYDLTPASFADIDPSVHEPGLVWGAAKAHIVLKRRRGTAR